MLKMMMFLLEHFEYEVNAFNKVFPEMKLYLLNPARGVRENDPTIIQSPLKARVGSCPM